MTNAGIEFTDDEWAEMRDDPRMVHLYDARRIVAALEHASLLLTEVRRLREALEYVTDRGVESGGCPGVDVHGPDHKDVLHVAPYHCEPETDCPICAALTPSTETGE